MKVYFASDHAGFELKAELISYVQSLHYDIEDLGPASFNPDDDYPDFVLPLAKRVANEEGAFGIVIGASGQGEAIAANRVRGARAAVYYDEPAKSQTDAAGNILNIVQSARAHNNANILSLGARFVTETGAKNAVKTFLQTPFSGEARHMRRVAKLDN